MARIKRTYLESLSILGLSSGASTEEIKDAYRNLVKQYHPDVYHLDGGEKFKEISSAYRFLKKYPDPPIQNENQARSTNPSSDYERRRRAYHRRKKERMFHEEVQREEMFEWIFSRIRLFVFIILIFNSLLLIDYMLPSVKEEVKISRINTVRIIYRHSSGSGKSDNSYKAELDNGVSFRFGKQEIGKIDIDKPVVLTRSMIIREGESIRNKKGDVIIYNEYGVFRVFGFLIPISILLIVAYLFYIRNNDYKLTIFLLSLIIFIFQLILIF